MSSVHVLRLLQAVEFLKNQVLFEHSDVTEHSYNRDFGHWNCTFGGVHVPCVYLHAWWELPKAIQVIVAVSIFWRGLSISFVGFSLKL